MKRLLLYACFFTVFTSFTIDYDLISTHAGLLYNVLARYVKVHPDYNADAVRSYLYSDATSIVFKDALAMGYSRRRVIKCCYGLAINADPFVESITQALQDDLKIYNMWKDV